MVKTFIKAIILAAAVSVCLQAADAKIAEKPGNRYSKPDKAKAAPRTPKAPARIVPKINTYGKPVPFKFPPPVSTGSYGYGGDKIGLAVGIKAGASAGLTGAMGDVSYSLNNIVQGASLRGSVGYLTGNKTGNDELKMATVNLDAIYNIGEFQQLPMNVYIGGGLIYPIKVNKNRGAGAWGAHAYLGSKYALQDNTSVYGELAYTGIKYQTDLPALRGVEAMLGYSYSF